MKTDLEHISIEQLMAEADDLVRQINAEVIGNLREEQSLQLEIHTRELERLKTELEGADPGAKTPKESSLADGMHQAILNIVTAMRDLTAYLT